MTTTRTTVVVVLAVASVAVGLYAFAAPTLAAPTITAGPANPTNQTSASFTYTHNKSVTFQCSLDGSGFTSCGTARPSTKTYLGPLAPGAHMFRVRAVSGSQTSAETPYPWTIDVTYPTVMSINRAGSTPTNASSVSWTVTFTENVTGVGTDDFALVNSGLVAPSIGSVAGSGSVFTLTVSTGSGSGTLGANLVDNDSIRDLAGNRLGGTGTGNGNGSGQTYSVDKSAPPAPVLTQKPSDPSPTANATFAWTDAEAGVSFQCSKENGAWFACSSPIGYEVAITNNEQHQFAVRARDAAGNVSAVVSYSWKVQKLDFTITGTVGFLYPGLWRQIEVAITNPNSFAIDVTSLTVAVTSSPAGCPASTNVEFQQAPLSNSHTLAIPPHSTVNVPAADRPQIRLKNLHQNQDVCKNGTFGLRYTGTGTK